MDYLDLIKRFLGITLEQEASDLHISAGHTPTVRITGQLVPLTKEKELTAADTEGIAFALMNDFQRKRFLEEKEMDFSYDFEGKARFRVNVFFQSGTISLALRLIPVKIKTIEELNLPPNLHEFTNKPQGLVLVTGASSQGKSTTLASILDEINHTRAVHIITIEDPIEYIYPDDRAIVDQREVYQDTLSFPNALKAIFRQNPDVIMVGEMRDLETISTTITAAETGHLVFATLHTNTAAQTIDRIVDVFPPGQQTQIRYQLSGSLIGIITQRLVPRIKGGFIPACEVMICNTAVQTLIREDKMHEIPAVIDTSAKEGMISMNRSLADLVRKKEISLKNAMEYSSNPASFRSFL